MSFSDRIPASLDVKGSLFSTVPEADAHRIIRWAIKKAGIVEGWTDLAFDCLKLELIRKKMSGDVRSASSLMLTICRRKAVEFKADTGLPFRVPPGALMGKKRIQMSVIEMDNPEFDMHSNSSVALEISDEDFLVEDVTDHESFDMAELGAEKAEMMDALYKALEGRRGVQRYYRQLVAGESAARAARIEGINNTTASGYLHEITQTARTLMLQREGLGQ